LTDEATRMFDAGDQIILATVAELRNQGVPHERIEEELESGWRVETVPPGNPPEEDAARQQIALVSVDRLNRALDEVKRLNDQLEEAKQQTQVERGRYEEAKEELTRLQREMGRLEGRLENLGKLEEEVRQLQEQLDEARKRRGLFGR
jgi:DNA repair exonuclease SbcCD ATPase subunit